MKKYGDPDHRHHERLTRIVANLAWRCATASMVPFDFAALGTWARNTLHRLDSLPVDEDSEALGAALDAFDQAATDFAGARRDLLDRDPDPSAVNRLDLGARRVFRRFLRNAETAGEGFFKNMLLAPDAQTSTDVMPLPFLTTALETADAEATSQALKELTIAFKESADLLSYVTTRLRRE